MKTHIWNQMPPFTNKVNFVDSNNVVLGYDLDQSCCETAEWTISENKDGTNPLLRGDDQSAFEKTLDGYVFDPDFYEVHHDEDKEEHTAVFRLRGVPRWGRGQWVDAGPDLYIHLWNRHNGYYSHGFVFRGAEVIKDTL